MNERSLAMRTKFLVEKLAILTLVLTALTSSFLSLPVLAQTTAQNNQGIKVEISPLPIELDAKPGTTTTTDLRVRNGGTQPETLKASLKTFSAEGPDGHVVLHDPTPADDFTKWVSFDKTTFTAQPGQWQTVKMTIAL